MAWTFGIAMTCCSGLRSPIPSIVLMVYALACIGITRDASAQDDARMRQLRLLCAQLSGDLTDPGGIAAFRHCLSSQDPLSEIRRDNQLGGNAPAAAVDHPGANPPKGFGHDGQSLLAD